MFLLDLFDCSLSSLERLAQRRAESEQRTQHLATGERGERDAFFHLRRQGFVVTARRWRSSRARGDLDLVAWDGDTLCFIEVKTRTTRTVAPAEAAVDHDKQKTLSRLAFEYLKQLQKEDVPVRFDVVSVYSEPGKSPEFEHFRGAFGWR
ncbi:YraN family protein [Silvibacterium sp.]|uniref:YraN family protein n=1 Tax=Silvibacterium sp. TaxID=1964179 RepID=UPI0039E5ED4B